MPTPPRDWLLDEIDARQDEVLERLAELNDSVEQLLSVARTPNAPATASGVPASRLRLMTGRPVVADGPVDAERTEHAASAGGAGGPVLRAVRKAA